jgi:hypothetical protein
MVVLAQQGVDGSVRARDRVRRTVAAVGDDDDGYRARVGKWRCLGGSWIVGECVGERREREEV